MNFWYNKVVKSVSFKLKYFAQCLTQICNLQARDGSLSKTSVQPNQRSFYVSYQRSYFEREEKYL